MLQLHGAGLTANVNALFTALPAFYGIKGTIYLDNKFFQYGCEEPGGGFHDIFEPGLVQPYTGAEEQQKCAYYTFPDNMRQPSFDIGVNYGDIRYDPGIVVQVRSFLKGTKNS